MEAKTMPLIDMDIGMGSREEALFGVVVDEELVPWSEFPSVGLGASEEAVAEEAGPADRAVRMGEVNVPFAIEAGTLAGAKTGVCRVEGTG